MEKNDKLKAEEIPGAGIEQEESEELDEYAERPLPGCYYIPDHYQVIKKNVWLKNAGIF
jgi:hypothetical protein